MRGGGTPNFKIWWKPRYFGIFTPLRQHYIVIDRKYGT